MKVETTRNEKVKRNKKFRCSVYSQIASFYQDVYRTQCYVERKLYVGTIDIVTMEVIILFSTNMR